jgi:hypothetical protein
VVGTSSITWNVIESNMEGSVSTGSENNNLTPGCVTVADGNRTIKTVTKGSEGQVLK